MQSEVGNVSLDDAQAVRSCWTGMMHQILPPLALLEGQQFRIQSCFEQVVHFNCCKGVLQLRLHGWETNTSQ